MANISLPTNIGFNPGERPNEGVLVVEPCHPGYGTTLGNALRRVLLSSLNGAAVTAVKIKGVTHEFQGIEGVKEDALEIILNLKQLRMKVHTDEPVKLTLKKSGTGEVKASDITANADVEIANPDLTLATVTDAGLEFEMELTIAKGRGYVPIEEREDENLELGTIAIDALFSPIRNVGYRVENTRVGDITNYDRLLLTIETDGTISPEDAVKEASSLLISHFSLLGGIAQAPQAKEAPVEEEVTEEVAENEEEA